MKKIMVFFLFILMSIGIVGCGSNNDGNEAVKEDLLNYANVELQKIVATEETVANSYESVTGTSYTTDENVISALESKIIPESSKLIEAARNIVPKTSEVQDVHAIYLSAVDEQHSAFNTMLPALKEQNLDKIKEANKKLDSARAKTEDYLKELQALATKNDIDFDMK